MNRYRHVGGAVMGEHGPLTLARALDLLRIYGRGAINCETAGARGLARAYARRTLSLHNAISEARRWRRAAGWRDLDAADAVRP
jgi:hypothetical protein